MTFLEALYGSQHQEISQNGKDGNKGRFNGNIFLAVLITLIIFTLFGILMLLSQGFKMSSLTFVEENFISGKAAGKLLAIPVIAISYFIISKTAGSEANFKKIIENFYCFPEDVRKTANKKLLTYFFIVFTVFIGVTMAL